jgi:hypothetical protein
VSTPFACLPAARRQENRLKLWPGRAASLAVVLAALALPPKAGATPVYSRKYASSCITCHTIYPKLNPFGEAFRRNGLRFPGAFDSDYVKLEVVELGQEANKKDFPAAVWPSWLTSIPGLAFGASSRVVLHPTTGSSAAVADNRAVVSLDRLVNGGNLFAAGSIDDSLSAFATVAVSDTAASLETAYVVWSDVVGPRHLVNLVVGSTNPTLTPFANGSSYLAGRQLFSVAMTTLYGGKNAPFRPTNRYNLLELKGVAAGRFEYSLGLNQGAHVGGARSAENTYGHLAVKLWGLRLDGERETAARGLSDVPGTESSWTLYGFAYRSNTRFDAAGSPSFQEVDVATTLGGGSRVQLGALELNLGGLRERHAHVSGLRGADGRLGRATQTALSGELSFLAYPWLAPALRVEHLIVSPTGGLSSNDTRILAGVSTLLRPNLRLAVSAVLERANRQADAGGAWRNLSGSGLWATPNDPASPVSPQLSFVNVDASIEF